jgi:hypothetical protein
MGEPNPNQFTRSRKYHKYFTSYKMIAIRNGFQIMAYPKCGNKYSGTSTISIRVAHPKHCLLYLTRYFSKLWYPQTTRMISILTISAVVAMRSLIRIYWGKRNHCRCLGQSYKIWFWMTLICPKQVFIIRTPKQQTN